MEQVIFVYLSDSQIQRGILKDMKAAYEMIKAADLETFDSAYRLFGFGGAEKRKEILEKLSFLESSHELKLIDGVDSIIPKENGYPTKYREPAQHLREGDYFQELICDKEDNWKVRFFKDSNVLFRVMTRTLTPNGWVLNMRPVHRDEIDAKCYNV